MLGDNVKISRQKLEFYYSIGIMIIIPALIVLLTYLMIVPTQKGFDRLRGIEADRINDLLSASFSGLADDPEAMQSLIDEISTEQPELENFYTALKQSDGSYSVIAARDTDLIGQTIGSETYGLVEATGRPIVVNGQGEDGGGFSRVASPIRDGDDGAVVGISSVDVSHELSESVISQILSRSLFVMMAVVTVIILLLLNHFKFVEYAALFRKLKEVDQMKSDFLSVATHELKAPMSVIKGSLENVMDGVAGEIDDKARENIQMAFNETDRLTSLVADLLNVSRIEQGKITYTPETFDPSEVINRVVRQYKPKAAAKGLSLDYEQLEDPHLIRVDRGRFQEIMTNLIDNAVKYSRSGTVNVSHKLEDDILKTVVRDTGVGMSAKERENLFQRFYRVRNENTRDIGGTGLGLWIIKQYIEAQDGHIYVDSLEGVGSEFTVEFPLAKDKTEAKTDSKDD